MIDSEKIIKYIEGIAPENLAENWDNVGLQIGDTKRKVEKILLALDINLEVVDKAVKEQVDMIISHHPLFFSSLKQINLNTYKGKIVEKLIKNDILVYTAHTNLDASNNGVNDELARLLDIENPKILSKTHSDKLYKVVVTVPETHEEEVRRAFGESGAGNIGNYSNCSFSYEGMGRFKPEQGSNPYLGSKEEIEVVKEIKIEVVVEESNLNNVLKQMINAHPYEEVAYDIIKLENKIKEYGIGRFGNIERITLKKLAEKTKQRLNIQNVRVYGSLEKNIEKIAVAGGSGADFILDAYKKGADVYITGDIKHHDAQIAKEIGLDLIDAGHFHTEKIVMDSIKKYLSSKIKSDIEIIVAENDNIAQYKTI
ncbi:Nif3-like dinuclear metal center hexameric protein [Senegalia massiliensis]|uniref:GTP cyclohydrolase 1 type 2 homolog n=1 Tax=Senegalia massiliensis TaxID=1720316 RepID=A0A845QWW9_9CLOT|nr:Nif3-like dinuclear metal center hexameric protein [Senegalia massiliensis]NBI06995.1 Nif3-like dinuclear metal center hexameric protein [Senegalia massiliensis]